MKGTSSPRSRHLHKHINATQACPREVTDLDGDDDAKKKMLKMSMFNRNVRGQLWSVVGLLAMVVVGASVYSGYSDISTLTIQIPSIATPFSSGNRIIPSTGGRKSTKTPTKTKTELPFFQSLSREENADIEHGEKYSIRKQSAALQHARGKLLPCRPDDANSCFQKTTSDPTDRVDNDYLPGIVLFNPLERGMTYIIVFVCFGSNGSCSQLFNKFGLVTQLRITYWINLDSQILVWKTDPWTQDNFGRRHSRRV